MKNVVIYPTPEVTDLIKLLRPDAVVRAYGESGNVEVSVKLTVDEQRAASKPKPGSENCYDLGEQWGVSADQAFAKMEAEGWTWAGYDDWGQEVFLPPMR